MFDESNLRPAPPVQFDTCSPWASAPDFQTTCQPARHDLTFAVRGGREANLSCCHREVPRPRQPGIEVERAIAEAREAAGASFARRSAAIDGLEVHVIDRLQTLHEHGLLRALHSEALELQERLEAANERFVTRLRGRIRAGRYTPAGLERALARRAGSSEGGWSYDTLDLLLASLFEAGPSEDERAEREPEMVAYQPTPGRIILQLLARADIRTDDVVFDLGSGLGWVVFLVALLRGSRAVGIEYEPTFVEYARCCADTLNLSRAGFVHADAREASLQEGTVFYLYTPFRGRVLHQVLERLRVEAGARAIRVCTYGPCTAEVARVGWLAPSAGDVTREDEVVVFRPVLTNPSRVALPSRDPPIPWENGREAAIRLEAGGGP